MAKLTFTFLIIDEEFQDTISYEVEPSFCLEDVIVHICNSFGFTNFDSIRSENEEEIEDIDASVAEIADLYGDRFKLVITPPDDSPEPSVDHTWQPAEPLPYPDQSQLIEDTIDELLNIRQAEWTVDKKGRGEIIFLPQLKSYITQLRVEFKVARAIKELIAKVAITCGYRPQEVIVAPLHKYGVILEDLDQSVEDIVAKYGSVFVIFPATRQQEFDEDPMRLNQWLLDHMVDYQ